MSMPVVESAPPDAKYVGYVVNQRGEQRASFSGPCLNTTQTPDGTRIDGLWLQQRGFYRLYRTSDDELCAVSTTRSQMVPPGQKTRGMILSSGGISICDCNCTVC